MRGWPSVARAPVAFKRASWAAALSAVEFVDVGAASSSGKALVGASVALVGCSTGTVKVAVGAEVTGGSVGSLVAGASLFGYL